MKNTTTPSSSPVFICKLISIGLISFFSFFTMACELEPEEITEPEQLDMQASSLTLAPIYLVKTNQWGFGFAVNAHYRYDGGNVNMYDYSSSDPDQKWYWDGYRLRLWGTTFCLHSDSYNPVDGDNVFLMTCSDSQNQKWFPYYEQGRYRIALWGSGYCLNAYNVQNLSNVNIWGCDSSDPDQRFEILGSGAKTP